MTTCILAIYSKSISDLDIQVWHNHGHFMQYIKSIVLDPQHREAKEKYDLFISACEHKVNWQYKNKEYAEFLAVKFEE